MSPEITLSGQRSKKPGGESLKLGRAALTQKPSPSWPTSSAMANVPTLFHRVSLCDPRRVPAPFVQRLLGVREKNGNPNTSDNNDDLSIELGRELIREVGLAADSIGHDAPGPAMANETIGHLRELRPDLLIGAESALEFAQYAHLRVYPEFKRAWTGTPKAMLALERAIEAAEPGIARARAETAARAAKEELTLQAAAVARLLDNMPEESMLALDITVGEETGAERPPLLQIGVSAKWSLRTDRAQDCVSQGSKLVSLRRGRMPHYAVLTMEPRPAMLKILADGSGAIDCVYHLDLAALGRAVDACANRRKDASGWSPKVTFERIVRQGRIRDYDDLVEEILRVPETPPPPAAGRAAP